MYGLLFNGQHSNDLGLYMKSKKRMILPATKDEYIEIPGRDGSILFAGTLTDHIDEIKFSVATTSLEALRAKSRQVAAWLFTRARSSLIYDDEPDLYYMAKVANQLDLEPMIAAGQFSVQWRCLPLAYSIVESTLSKTVTTTPETINYAGTYNALPIITITATGDITNPSITIEDKTLIYTGTLTAGQSLVINCGTYQVTKAGANVMGSVSGYFPVLYPGDNEVTMSAGCSLQIVYRERWL